MTRSRFGPVGLTACGILVLRASLWPVFAGAPIAPVSVVAPAAAPHVQRESPWFIIAGGDAAQNAGVAGLADRVVARLEDVGFSAADLGGRKLVVRLAEGAAPPRLYPGGGETVLVLPRAHGVVAPGDTARRLVAAFGCRLALAHAREGAPAPWWVAALAEEALSTGNVSAVEASARLALADGPPDLARLETGFATDTPAGRRASFWLYRALRSDARNRTALTAEAMCGTSVAALRRRFLPEDPDEASRDLWWPVAFYRLTMERADALSGSAAAEHRYVELNRFVVAESAEDSPLDDAGLIARRDREGVREVVASRLLTLKFDLLRVNPLWGNAYVARGLFWEKLADPKTPPETLRRLAAEADAEARAARTLGAEARRLLMR